MTDNAAKEDVNAPALPPIGLGLMLPAVHRISEALDPVTNPGAMQKLLAVVGESRFATEPAAQT